MTPLKLVITGPVGAGKSTFIQTVATADWLDTDESATEALGKLRTTVAFDFGSLCLDGKPVFLFGTPGQERFDYMWDVLCEGARGLILLVASDKPQDYPQARTMLETLTQNGLPYAIGVTRRDRADVSLAHIARALGVPLERLVGLDAREPETARVALMTLLTTMQLAA